MSGGFKPTILEIDEFTEKYLWPAMTKLFDASYAHMCQMDAMAEDHSERMHPYEGDAGDETDSAG